MKNRNTHLFIVFNVRISLRLATGSYWVKQKEIFLSKNPADHLYLPCLLPRLKTKISLGHFLLHFYSYCCHLSQQLKIISKWQKIEQHFKLISFYEFYLGQCEAGFWNGHSCSTVVSQVIAWTEENKTQTSKCVLFRKNREVLSL